MRWNSGQRAVRAAMVGAMAVSGLTFANAPSAMAAFSGWATQIGPSGSGCYEYVTYTSNILTPHIWQQAGNSSDSCFMWVEHIGYDGNGATAYTDAWPSWDGDEWTAGAATGVDGPSWYYGPWNGGKMCVYIEVGDLDGNPGTYGNWNKICPW